MGMQIFEASGTFDPAANGLSIGDVVNIIAVGGGGSGGGNNSSSTHNSGLAGAASSYASILTAAGAAANGAGNVTISAPQAGSMGAGGPADAYVGGGGAGGYEPAFPLLGGNGGLGDYNGAAYTVAIPSIRSQPSGLGGLGGFYTTSLPYYQQLSVASPYANGRRAGKGTRDATAPTGTAIGTAGASGNGFGAGGGGAGNTGGNAGGHGGHAGSIAQGSFVLASTASVAVTVGAGGAVAGTAQVGGKGASGCVIVFW